MGCSASTSDSQAPANPRGSKGSKRRTATTRTKRVQPGDEESQVQTSLTLMEQSSLRTHSGNGSRRGSDKTAGFLTVVCVKEATVPLRDKSPDKDRLCLDVPHTVTLVKETPAIVDTEQQPRHTPETIGDKC